MIEVHSQNRCLTAYGIVVAASNVPEDLGIITPAVQRIASQQYELFENIFLNTDSFFILSFPILYLLRNFLL